MARKSPSRRLRGTEVECLCPECGRLHVRSMRYVPAGARLTPLGRPILLCKACTWEPKPKPHKDLPGQQTFC